MAPLYPRFLKVGLRSSFWSLPSQEAASARGAPDISPARKRWDHMPSSPSAGGAANISPARKGWEPKRKRGERHRCDTLPSRRSPHLCQYGHISHPPSRSLLPPLITSSPEASSVATFAKLSYLRLPFQENLHSACGPNGNASSEKIRVLRPDRHTESQRRRQYWPVLFIPAP